jgi:hypothetical protein
MELARKCERAYTPQPRGNAYRWLLPPSCFGFRETDDSLPYKIVLLAKEPGTQTRRMPGAPRSKPIVSFPAPWASCLERGAHFHLSRILNPACSK